MKKVLLLVDLYNLIMRGASVNGSMKDSIGRYTGGLYGLISQIAATANTYKATHILVCQDCPPYFRKSETEDYKGGRNPQAKGDNGEKLSVRELRRFTVPLYAELQDKLGIPTIGVKGFEADDLMVHAVNSFKDEFDLIVIASNDSDLHQIFHEDIPAVQHTAKGPFDHDSYLEKYGPLSEDDWITHLAMQGTHNNVVGIQGVGPKTALKCVTEKNRKYFEILDKHGKLIDLNKKLITLPWEGMDDYKIPNDLKLWAYTERRFIQYLGKYDIKMTSNMAEAFDRLS